MERLTNHKTEVTISLAVLSLAVFAIGSKRFLDWRKNEKALRLPYELLLQ